MLRTNSQFLSFIEELYNEPEQKNIVLRTYPKETLLYKQDEMPHRVSILKEGFVKCFNSKENGKDYIFEFLGKGEIIGEKTLDANKIYLLRGFVYVYTSDVNNPSVLTIPAGTVIKGEKATKGALIIEPGSKIIAKGTVDKPIVFTSDQPAGQRNYGDWGGLILCGNARVNSNRPQI